MAPSYGRPTAQLRGVLESYIIFIIAIDSVVRKWLSLMMEYGVVVHNGVGKVADQSFLCTMWKMDSCDLGTHSGLGQKIIPPDRPGG